MRGYDLAELFQGCECFLDVQWLIEGWSGEFTIIKVDPGCTTHKVVRHTSASDTSPTE